MADEGRGGEGGGRAGAEVTSPWEWVAGLVGAVLVAGTIAFLGYEAATERDTPPELVIEVDSVVRTAGGHVVEFRVHNRGGTTAADVEIAGELRGGAGVVETGGLTVDYVPAGSTRRAGLIFREDPRRHRLEIRATGYDLP